mmetsp:Transcript_18303/g.50201  ORF Transcript_18303/g.50201 Transcript_18303/m.50201 type:complete len:281 (-) Transcript_18303:50-892(-)
MGHYTPVEVFATQVRVAARRENIEYATLDAQHRDIECAAAQIVYEHCFRSDLVHAIGEGGSCGLVQHPEHLEPGDGPCVFGRLPLSVVEVRRHCDHGVFDAGSQIRLRGLFQLAEYRRRNFLGRHEIRPRRNHQLPVFLCDAKRESCFVGLDTGVIEAPADEALHVENRLLRVRRCLILCGLAHQALVANIGDVGGRHTITLVVGDDLHETVLVDTHARISRAEVDADDWPWNLEAAIDVLATHRANGPVRDNQHPWRDAHEGAHARRMAHGRKHCRRCT